MLTGLPLKYAQTGLAQELVAAEGGMTWRGALHRGVAGVLMGLCLYHLLSLLFSRRAHEDFLALLPTRQDFRDLAVMVRYNLGRSPEKARFGRFSYVQKLQYFIVALGALVMVSSGLILWFETQAMLLLPKWTLDAARILHSQGATLTYLIIIVWHLYNVHLQPRTFPFSRTWLTGKVSAAEMKEQHPREYEQWLAERKRQEDEG
jgi:cytochrome b subunit of formate dehydrogenase